MAATLSAVSPDTTHDSRRQGIDLLASGLAVGSRADLASVLTDDARIVATTEEGLETDWMADLERRAWDSEFNTVFIVEDMQIKGDRAHVRLLETSDFHRVLGLTSGRMTAEIRFREGMIAEVRLGSRASYDDASGSPLSATVKEAVKKEASLGSGLLRNGKLVRTAQAAAAWRKVLKGMAPGGAAPIVVQPVANEKASFVPSVDAL